ncbi:hypothetical protein [Blastococcus sp. SYSU D00820]
MRNTQDGRAAAFARSSFDVEIEEAGTWRPGSMLGWRHEGGVAQAQVRSVVDGVERTSWIDLTAVRLPQPPAAETSATDARRVEAPQVEVAQVDVPVVVAAPVTPSAAVRAEELHPATVVMSRAALRELLAADGRPAGRRSAPAGSEPAPRAERRRRHGADLTAEFPAVRCGDDAAGRHRAPAHGGRHRAADTGVLPAVAAEPASVDMLTRPIRLGDTAPWGRDEAAGVAVAG